MSTIVGEILKKNRIQKGYSLEDVSRAIHIRHYFIEAIEEGRLDELPSAVQAKGFIRLYSEWLGLSSSDLVEELDRKEIETDLSSTSDTLVQTDTRQSLFPDSLSKLFSNNKASLNNEGKNTSDDSSAVQSDEIFDDDSSSEIIEDSTIPSGSQEVFKQIGEQLRTCRQKLDISVDEIEKLTHIRARHLIDMESGNFNNIPSLVQARGLLTGYTSFLNLDGDEILGLFAEALQKRRIELLPPETEQINGIKTKKKSNFSSERSGLFRFISFDFLVGSITIIGLVGFGIFSASMVISSNREKKEAPPPIADVLLQIPTGDLNSILTPTSDFTQEARNPESIGLLPTVNPFADSTIIEGSPTPPVPDLGEASMQVYIIPNQRVFLQVTTEKKVAYIGRTIPGNAYPFTSDERIEVVSGNAAALQIYYNQRDLGTLGLSGQPLRLIFSKDGISTPTPSQPSAPISTQIPTLTLRPSATMIPPTVTPLIP